MKKLFVLAFCSLTVICSFAQRELSLDDVIEIAKEKSIRSKQIENRYQNSYWRNFSFKRQFLPSLAFDGTIPEFQRSFSSITLDDGTEEFVNRNVISNRANLSLNQIFPPVKGTILFAQALSLLLPKGEYYQGLSEQNCSLNWRKYFCSLRP